MAPLRRGLPGFNLRRAVRVASFVAVAHVARRCIQGLAFVGPPEHVSVSGRGSASSAAIADRSTWKPAGDDGIGSEHQAVRPLIATLGALGGAGLLGSEGAWAAATPAADAGLINPVDAILQAFALTFVSEIGDKTFFIAAILAAGGADGAKGESSQKILTFVGAIAALAVMTLIAVAIGQIFHSVPDVAGGLPLDDYASILAFGYFGVKLLLDASNMADDGSILAEEREEAEEAVKAQALPAWISGSGSFVLPSLVFQAFTLVFAAEVGDRSFISAAALSAQGGPTGAASVFVGAITAHGIATLIAVVLGELISKYISEKTITYIGGALFVVFAATSTAHLLGAIE